jgi:hypothetical protein
MKITRIIVIFLILTAGLQARNQRDFGFGAMEIFEFSNLTSNLRVYDMNRDGLDDILFLDNRVSRLEVLTRKKTGAETEELPSLEERFDKKGFVLDNWAIDFKAADLDRDNRPDIVTLDDQRGVQIYFQQPDGVFAKPLSLSLKDPAKLKAFEIADLNNDGNPDILVVRPEKAEILQNNGRGEFKTRTEVDFSAYGCQEVMISDIDGDKIADLLLYFPKEGLPLRIRPGKSEGQFGWEEALELPDTRAIEKFDLNNSGLCQLGMILKNGLILRLYGFESRPGKPLFSEGESELIPRRLPLKGISRKQAPSWTAADIDGDGYTDFCVAAPLLNQVHIYKGSDAGISFTPVAVDSLRDIKTMALTGQGDLVVFSEAEKAVAIHKNKNITAFPQFLKAPGEPAAAAAAGDATVFTLFKDQNLDYTLCLFNAQTPEAPPFESTKTSLRNSPSAMQVFPLDGAGNTPDWAVMLFMPYDKPIMYRLREGKLSPLTVEHFRALGAALKPQAVVVVGLTGPKKEQSLLVTEGNVARSYRWDRELGQFVIEGQLNPGVETARFTAGCRCMLDEKTYLLYDDAGQEVYRIPAAKAGEITHIHIKDAVKELTGIATVKLKDSRGILMVGESEIQWLQEGLPSLDLKNLSEYVSGMEKPSLWNLFPVFLGNPGRPMAALLDANNNSVELVAYKEGKLMEELVFEVFQDAGFNEQTAETIYEPHDLVSGDFNGDTIRDLAVLVHDKLIIYLGE